ncbi:MAG: enoyl-CoA hydratase-related protein [Thalassovita sp.]
MTDMTPPPLVQPHLAEGVLTLTLGAGVAHPMSLAMIHALHEQIRNAANDQAVSAIVIHGPGHIFCAGHDLKEIDAHRKDPDHGEAYLTQLFNDCSAMMLDLTNCPKPSIALVEGIATAGGLQLVAACDLAYATPDATFCLPGVVNGGFCTTPAVAISRNLSRKHLMELALSGSPMDANWALATGLINRILPAEKIHPFTVEFARKIASYHAPAIASGKETLYQHLEMPLEQAYALATKTMVGHFMDQHRIEKDQKR